MGGKEIADVGTPCARVLSLAPACFLPSLLGNRSGDGSAVRTAPSQAVSADGLTFVLAARAGFGTKREPSPPAARLTPLSFSLLCSFSCSRPVVPNAPPPSPLPLMDKNAARHKTHSSSCEVTGAFATRWRAPSGCHSARCDISAVQKITHRVRPKRQSSATKKDGETSRQYH